ncbi:MAG: 2-hydroxychromene-2-carboxylate isomerase [Pseudomonadota bacterium]
MPADIDFYFDFASPYSYLAANRINRIAALRRRKVNWHPLVVTALYQANGTPPTPTLPVKWEYVRKDVKRIARNERIPFREPPGYPRILLTPGRAMLWIRAVHGDETAVLFARTCFHAYFGDGVDIGDVDVLAGIAAGLGVQKDALLAGMADDAIKGELKNGSTLAFQKGVFGVPFVIADGEHFWGFDRFPLLAQWLSRGRKGPVLDMAA